MPLAVSDDGGLIGFGYLSSGHERAHLDVASLKLLPRPAQDGRVAPPDQASLGITGWHDDDRPRLLGRALALDDYEMARSLAIAADDGPFLLGLTGTWVPWTRGTYALAPTHPRRRLGGQCLRRWSPRRSGLGDGTIRWLRMEDGTEILALFLLPDRKNWVAWTPDGFYAATPGARTMLRWHVDRG